MEKLAANLRFLREKFNLSQAGMQSQTGVKRTAWVNYEGGNSVPDLRQFIKIADFFGVTESDLLHKDMSKDRNLIADK